MSCCVKVNSFRTSVRAENNLSYCAMAKNSHFDDLAGKCCFVLVARVEGLLVVVACLCYYEG